MKAGIFGLGGMGTKHCQVYDSLPETIVAVGVDVDEDARERFERRHRAPAYPSVSEALAAVDVDVASITSPHGYHFEQAKTAVDAGVPVLVEKPMVISTEEGIDLVELSDDRDVPIQVGYQRRYLQAFRELKKTLRTGTIGTPRVVNAHLGQDWLSGNADSWRSDPATAGGGQLFDTGSHLLEILLWLLDAVPRTVSARVDRRGQDVDVNSLLSLQLDAPDSSILASVAITGESTDLASDEYIAIWGDGGRLSFRRDRHASPPSHLRIVRPGRSTYTTDFGSLATPDPTTSKVQRFVDSVLHDTEPSPSAEHGLLLAALRDAAINSSQTGAQVELSDRLEGVHPRY